MAHVVRRESRQRGCDESQANMAKLCGMSQRKVLEVLNVLCKAGLLRKEKSRTRRTNIYRLNPGSKWKDPKELENIRVMAKSAKTSKQVNESENLESENMSGNNIFVEEELLPDPWALK